VVGVAVLSFSSYVLSLIVSLRQYGSAEIHAGLVVGAANSLSFGIGCALICGAFLSSPTRRPRILGIAAIALGIALSLGLVAQVLLLRYFTLASHWTVNGREVAIHILLVFSPLMQVIGVSIAAIGFLKASGSRGSAQEFRERHLGWGAIFVAIAFLALCSSWILVVSQSTESTVGGEFTTSETVEATSFFVMTIGWLLAAMAFLGRQRPESNGGSESLKRRDGLLAWSCGVGAVALLGAGVASTTLDNLHSAKGLNQIAIFLFTGARYVEAVAALLASAAFLMSRRQSLSPRSLANQALRVEPEL